jgi:hypothetical protein
LHRNRIVHSGEFINEYSNLWSHLEWYLAKILSCCYIYYFENGSKADFQRSDAFLKIESDAEMLSSMLKTNLNMHIREVPELQKAIFKHTWLFC